MMTSTKFGQKISRFKELFGILLAEVLDKITERKTQSKINH
jgi:hypothetical protein